MCKNKKNILALALFIYSFSAYGQNFGPYYMKGYDYNYPDADRSIRDIEYYLNSNYGKLSQEEIINAEKMRSNRITELMKEKFNQSISEHNSELDKYSKGVSYAYSSQAYQQPPPPTTKFSQPQSFSNSPQPRQKEQRFPVTNTYIPNSLR